jgi:hypothetical protein
MGMPAKPGVVLVLVLVLMSVVCPCLAAESAAPPRVWVELEYLGWWTKGRDLPPLVTTAPRGTPQPQAGVIGQPGTQIVFGGDSVGEDRRDGGRVTVGAWLIPDSLGIELRYFELRGSAERFAAGSNGNPILALPFFNTQLGQRDAQLVAYPGLSGRVDASAKLDVQGGDLLARKSLYRDGSRRIDLLLGLMQTKVSDDVTLIASSVVVNPGVIPVGTTVDVTDRFRTDNDFLGISAGASGSLRHERWSLNGLVKLAYGRMEQSVTILGSTTVAGPGLASTTVGGRFAQPSNIGSFSRDKQIFVPEIGLNASYALARGFSVAVGYSAIYWSRVALAGDQIDTNVNPAQTGPAPVFRFRDTHFWAQGPTIGLRAEW